MINKKIGNKRKTEVHALGHIYMSPHKVRRVIAHIRGRSYLDTVMLLGGMPYYQVAYEIYKIVLNAGANASYTRGYKEMNLIISKAEVHEGITGKKWKPRARGRSYSIKRRTCHIRIVVKDRSLDKEKSTCKNKDTNMIYHNMYSSGRGLWDKK